MSPEDPWTTDILRDCPACGLPAEVVERFGVDGSPRPVEHLKLVCVAGHWVTAPVDSLALTDHPREDGSHPLRLANVSELAVGGSARLRPRRLVRRLKRVWKELDYAQRRLFEIQTGVPVTEQ
jgi:hypothetical protein